ncbi:MAG: hypothetical protein V2A58_13610 [Planctomycetota bacterium]
MFGGCTLAGRLCLAATLLSSCLRAEEAATEVVVIATQHFITDLPEGYTPGHLRALLDKVNPQVLAVEAPTNLINPWAQAPFELAKVTKPWAEERGAEVVPAGWYEAGYERGLSEMFREFEAQGKMPEYRAAEKTFQEESGKQPLTCEFLNSDAGHALWREYHAKLRELYGKETPWETWNEKIARRVLAMCSENSGKTVAVVFGAAHCYYLLDRLSAEQGITLRPTQEFSPLSREEVEKETRARDYLLALRLLNYGALAPGVLNRMEGILEKVKETGQFSGDHDLFRGKYLLHRGKALEALEAFLAVARRDAKEVSAFDGVTVLREAGLVYAAIAKDRLGRREEARADLEGILVMNWVSDLTKEWVKGILAGMEP